MTLDFLTQPRTRFQLPNLVWHRDSTKVTGVEVGTDQGAYADQLLRAYPNLFLVTVDPWLPYPEIVNLQGQMDDRRLARERYADNMKPHDGRYIHIEMPSVMAAYHLANERESASGFVPPYDFVYVDAAHNYEAVCVDLKSWWPLVRVGGVLSGHDFDVPDVSREVIEFAKRHRCDLQIINEHGSPKDMGGKPGTGVDVLGTWARPSWYWYRERADQ